MMSGQVLEVLLDAGDPRAAGGDPSEPEPVPPTGPMPSVHPPRADWDT